MSKFKSQNEEYEILAEENESLIAENSILSEKAEKVSELEELLTSILSENSDDGATTSKNESPWNESCFRFYTNSVTRYSTALNF